MLQTLKRLLVVLTAAILTHSAFGFALLGPRDTWQINALGYDPQADNGDLGGPKNLGEEWRWNVPEITYGFDQSFITYFGTNGMNAVEAGLEAFNREMTNFAGLSDTALLMKPTDTRRINETARSLGVLDLKSTAMGMIAEQLGLAGAERWTFALRSRAVPNPNVTNFFVVQRNFDPFTRKPTPYVNGHRFTYQVKQFPALLFAADFESTSVFPVDQSAALSGTVSALVGEDLTSVPNLRLHAGEFFAALTRDDIAGLRYIYTRDNVNTEDVIPNTFFTLIDRSVVNFVRGTNAFDFFQFASLNPPTNLLAAFPGLEITSTNVSVTNIVTTNVFVTNIVSPGLFTNLAALTLITNLDLFTFSEASRTNGPAQLRALYPELIITKTNSFPVSQVSEVYTSVVSPWGQVGDPAIIVTNYVTNLVANYKYEYANSITNYASSVTTLDVQNFLPAPWGQTGLEIATNHTYLQTNINSGGFYILDRATNANLVGYSFEDELGVPLFRATNYVAVSNTTILLITNSLNGLVTSKRTDVVNTFTNVVYAAYPVLINQNVGEQVVTTTTTNLTTRYDYTFGNLLVVPSANGNNTVTLQTITPTGVSNQQIPSPFPTGTVLVLDTNQFVLTGQQIESFGFETNVLISFTNATTGNFLVQQLIIQTNTILFAVNPVILQSAAGAALRPGVNSLQFRQIRFSDFLGQSNAISTNFYTAITITNNTRYTNVFRRVAGPDILFTAGDIGVTTGGFPIALARSVNFQLGNAPAPAQVDGGPGLIGPGANIIFSKNLPYFWNQSPNLVTEDTADIFFVWGSFDGRTTTPRIYPEELNTQLTLEQLEAFALRRNPPR